MPSKPILVSLGKPGKIGGVHIDLILGVSAPRSYESTDVPTETGAPVRLHRRRPRWVREVSILISDIEPIAGASLLGLWEGNHATKTRDRLHELSDTGELVDFFDGARIYKPPGSPRKTWEISNIAEDLRPEEQGTTHKAFRATVTLTERPQFSTSFTSLADNVDESVQDGVDGAVDNGAQSTEAAPDGAGVELN